MTEILGNDVVGWGNFNYCQTAIDKDKSNGFIVEVIKNDRECNSA